MDDERGSRRTGDNGGSRPVPDPTVLTDRAIDKAIVALRDYIDGQMGIRDQRIDGIDEATKLRLSGIEGIPAMIQATVGSIERLHDEKFHSIATQFSERDTRGEREARDNKVAVDAAFSASKEAVAAALTAQKEASSKQDESNQKAIDKSEVATSEKINKLAELFQTTTDALGDKIDDLKERLNDVAGVASGSVNRQMGAREDRTALYASLVIVVMVISVAVTILSRLIP